MPPHSTRRSSSWRIRGSRPSSRPATRAPTPLRPRVTSAPPTCPSTPRGQPVRHASAAPPAVDGTLTGPTGPPRSPSRASGPGAGTTFAPWAATNGTDLRPMRRRQFVVGGGGGFSVIEPEPSYQRLVSGTVELPRGAVPDPDRLPGRRARHNFAEPTSWNVTSTPPLVCGTGSGRAGPTCPRTRTRSPVTCSTSRRLCRAANPALAGRLGWHELRGTPVQRLDGRHRLLPGPPESGLWNPRLYSFAGGPRQPRHAAQPGWAPATTTSSSPATPASDTTRPRASASRISRGSPRT